MRHLLLLALACVAACAHAANAASSPDGIRFAFDAGSPIRSTPAVHRGTLLFGNSDGTFFALDARTGRERWRLRTGGAIASSPAAANGRAYFASRDGILYCVDASTGKVAWRHRFKPDLGPNHFWDYHHSSPALSDGRVFIGSGDGHVYALDASTGRVRWSANTGARVRSTPAVQDGVVVVGTTSGHVRAFDARDGQPRWSFATAGATNRFEQFGYDPTSVLARPTIAEGRVFVGGRDGFLYALDLATGAQVWRATHDGSSWIQSTLFDAGTLYVGSGSAQIVQAADPATGAERWRSKTLGPLFASLALSGDTLLFTDFSGTLYAIDRRNGAGRWQFPMGGRSLSTPVVADGVVYAASDTGVLFAFDLARRVTQGAQTPRRIVHREGMKSAEAFSWFKGGVDAAVHAQLQSVGYETLDATQLEAFMHQHVAAPAPGVVVFTDNKIPASLADDAQGPALIRRYLDTGGKVVLLGPNPLAFRADAATGKVTAIDFAVPARVFGIAYPEIERVGGYYATRLTADGRAMGLRRAPVSYLGIEPARVEQLTVLARDEFGRAGAWLKGYGGPRGTGLLQLAVPRMDLVALAELQAAIEYGVTW